MGAERAVVRLAPLNQVRRLEHVLRHHRAAVLVVMHLLHLLD